MLIIDMQIPSLRATERPAGIHSVLLHPGLGKLGQMLMLIHISKR